MESYHDLSKACELSCETSCTTTSSNEGSKNKSDHEIIESSYDVMVLPISQILRMGPNKRYNGSYFKKVVNEVINLPKAPTTNLSSKIVQLNKIFKLQIVLLKLKLNIQTYFGESVQVAGSSDFLGSWSNPKEMYYTDACWIREFRDGEEKSLSKDSSIDYFSQISSSVNGDLNSNRAEATFICGNGFEFKFILNKCGQREWESIENRIFCFKYHEDHIKSLIIESGLGMGQAQTINYTVNGIMYSYHTNRCMLEVNCWWNRK